MTARSRRLSMVLAAVAAMAMTPVPGRAADAAAAGIEAMVRSVTLAQSGRAAHFTAQSRLLRERLATHCDGTGPPSSLGAAQAQWRVTVSAWDHLAALGAGPLLQRHSASRIDFKPLRPALLEQAIAAMPASEAEMDRIGAAARGFSALEALLWPGPLPARSPRCVYAVALASEIEREAQALDIAFRQQLAAPAGPEVTRARFDEMFNRWLGGLEQLRWTFMRKPVEVARSFGGPPLYPRRPSGHAAATWNARWSTLREMAVSGAGPTVVPAEASMETVLRGRSMNALADRLTDLVARAGKAIAPLKDADRERVRAASLRLGDLSAFAQQELAPVLGVRLEFSDSDGD